MGLGETLAASHLPVHGFGLSISFSTRVGLFWQGLQAQELKAQTVYAIEDAEEVRLVDDLPGEDRLSFFGLHLHPFEGHSVSVAEFASHHYAVDRSCTFAHHLFILLVACLIPRSDDPANLGVW